MITSDIIRLAQVGGGQRIDCSNKLVSDLIHIALAAKGHSYLFLENTHKLLLSDKLRIASAGGGYVIFNDIVWNNVD